MLVQIIILSFFSIIYSQQLRGHVSKSFPCHFSQRGFSQPIRPILVLSVYMIVICLSAASLAVIDSR